LAFAGQMAKDVPGMATELGNELGKPEAERDYKKIAQLTTSGIAQTAFTVGGAMHGAAHPLIEATGAVPLMKAAETIKPVAPLTAAALEQQAGSTVGKKVEAEFNPEPAKAPEVPPVEMPIAPEKGAENAEAIRGDQGQLPSSGETAVTGEEAGGHDVQPPPPEQPEPVEPGKAEEVAPTEEPVTEASLSAEKSDYEKALESSLESVEMHKEENKKLLQTHPAAFMAEEITRLKRKESILKEMEALPRTVEDLKGMSRADVERLRDDGKITDSLFYEYAKLWNKTPRFGELMPEGPTPPETTPLAAEAAPQQPTVAEPQSATISRENTLDLGDGFRALIDARSGSVVYENARGEQVGRLETGEGPNGELMVENHSLDDEARGHAFGQKAIAKLSELTGKTIISDEHPSSAARNMWDRLGAKRERTTLGQPGFEEEQMRYVLRPVEQTNGKGLEPQSAVPEPTESLSKEASPSESVPEAGAPPVPESPSVEAAPKTDLGAAPAVEQRPKTVDEYLRVSELDPMDAGRMQQTLSKQVSKRGNDKIYSGDRATVVQQMLDDGYAPTTEQVNAVADVSRTKWNRMDGREQDAFEKRQKEAGKKTEYRLEHPNGSLFDVTKAEYDYAKWLKGKEATPAPTSKLEKEAQAIKEAARTTPGLTPMMEQYQRLKSKLSADHPNALLAFRLGDFYEFFFDDAKVAADKLKIALTKRGDVQMAGIPFHAANDYFKRLNAEGHAVAIADTADLPTPKPGKPAERLVTDVFEATGKGPLTDAERREVNELRRIREDKGKLGTLNTRRLEALEERDKENATTETPATAAAKVEAEVKQVAATEGQRPAKEVKSELVARLEKAIEEAPSEAGLVDPSKVILKGEKVSGGTATRRRFGPVKDYLLSEVEAHPDDYRVGSFALENARNAAKQTAREKLGKVTIDIPGDGSFTIFNTKEALGDILARAEAIETKAGGGKNYSENLPSKQQREASLKEAEDLAKKTTAVAPGESPAPKAPESSVEVPEVQSQHPPEGTPAGDEFKKQYTEASGKTEAAYKKLQELKAQREKAGYGTKRREELDRKAEKASEEYDKLYAISEPMRQKSYEMNLERTIKEGAPEQKLAAAVELMQRRKDPRYRETSDKAYETLKAEAKRRLMEQGVKESDAESEALSLVSSTMSYPASDFARFDERITTKKKIVGMGGAIPEEFARGQGSATSIKNATVDSERAKRGLPPAMEPARRSFGQVWDQAMAAVDRDPKVVDALIESLQKKPRALTDFEDALLLHRQLDLHHEYDKATRDLAQAYEDAKQFPEREAQAVEEKLRVARLSDELQSLYDLGKKVGTETGRGLNARKMMAHEDFTLAKMELESRAARGGRQLTDGERAEITALHDKIAESQKRYDEYVSQSQDRISKLEAQAAIDKLKVEAAKEGPAIHPKIIEIAEKLVKQLDARADAARARIKARMGKFNAGVDPTVLLDVADIGASYLGHKVLDSVKWADKMVGELGEWIRPHLDEIRKASEKRVNDLADKSGRAVEVKKALTGLPVEEQAKAIAEKIKEKKDKGKLDEITWYVQRLARIFVQGGIKDREALIDKVHEAIAKLSRTRPEGRRWT
jgi:hypothetical protein